MMRRTVFLLAALLAGATMFAGAASAAPRQTADPYTACPGLTVNPPSPQRGDNVHVTGTAFSPNATIDIFITGRTAPIVQTTSLGDGSFAADFTVPNDAPDSVTVQARQQGDNTDPFVGCPAQVATLDIVRPAAAAEPLARTGSNSSLPLARLGFGLLAAGGLAVVVSRRRRASVSANA